MEAGHEVVAEVRLVEAPPFASMPVMWLKPRSTHAVEMGAVSRNSISSDSSFQNGRMRIQYGVGLALSASVA